MSVDIIGSKATVHWLSSTKSVTLTKDQGILYVCPKGLGQVTRSTAAGLTPAQAFEYRYSGQKSSLLQDLVAEDIIVFDKIHGDNYDYDDSVRDFINHLNLRGEIGFHANVNSRQTRNTNSEALLNYNRTSHVNQLINTVKQYFKLGTYYNTHTPFQPRYGQLWAIDQIVSGLVKYDKVLFAGYTGIGKSKIALEAVHQCYSSGAVVLITTPITETITSFKDAISDTRFGNSPARQTEIYSTDDMPSVKDIKKSVVAGNIVIVIATVQDIRYQDNVSVNLSDKKLRKKYISLCKIVDLWIRDEYHKEYGGQVTREVFNTIKTSKKLDLTATPYSVIDEYDQDQVIARTLMWAVANRINTGVPNFGIDCLAGLLPLNMSKYGDLFSESEGFHSHKLVEQNKETGEFVNFGIIEDMIQRAYCMSTVSRKKNVFSISNDAELSLVARAVGLWIMPEGANGISASEYIVSLADKLNRSGVINKNILVTTAYEIDNNRRHMSVEEYINSIKDHRTLIILTHGKFKTGTDIPCLGHIVLLDKISNIAEFEQTVGRIMRVYVNKDYTKMYVYSPGVTVKEVVTELAHQNTKLATDEIRDELEFLSCFPISEYNGLIVNRIDPVALFEEFKEKLRLKCAIANFKLPSEVRSMIEDIPDIADSLSVLSKKNGKRDRLSVDVTEDNNSEVFEDRGVKSKKSTSAVSDQKYINQIINGLEEIWINVPPFAMITDSNQIIDVLQCEPLVEMFGHDQIETVVDVLNRYPDFKKRLQLRLNVFLTAFRDLPPEQSYDSVFKNCDKKMKQGLVFTPFSLVNELLDKLPMDEYNAKYSVTS